MSEETPKKQSLVTKSIGYIAFVGCIILFYCIYSLKQDMNAIKNTSFQTIKSDGVCIITDEHNPIIIKEQDEKADSITVGLIFISILVFIVMSLVFIFIHRIFKKNDKSAKTTYVYGVITVVISSFILIRFLYEKPTSVTDFSFDFRGGIDEPTMILLGALISILALWYKGKSISNTIDWILGETPKEDELDKKVELESRKMDYNTNDDEPQKEYDEKYKSIFFTNNSDIQILEIIAKEIENNSLEIANESKREGERLPIGGVNLANFLREKNILSEQFRYIIIEFYTLKSASKHKNSLKRLIEIGCKIWRLVIRKKYDYNKKIKYIKESDKENIRILPGQIKEGVSILDCEVKIKVDNDYYINLEYLNKHDVRIETIVEVKKGDANEEKNISIMPQSVTYLEEEKINLRLCLIIDDSLSMSMNGKSFELVKEQASYILKLLENYENVNAKILVSKLLDYSDNKSVTFSWSKIDSSIKTIEALELQGVSDSKHGTPLYYTINKCLEKMNEDECLKKDECLSMMIVLSDGEDNMDKNREQHQAVMKKLKAVGKPVIKFIGYKFNVDKSSSIVDIVKASCAGEEGIGYFVDVENEKLNSVFENIIQSVLKRYRIVWKSPGGKVNKIIITIAGIEKEADL
jgi:hypothetical protein